MVIGDDDMNIVVRTEDEINKLRQAGKIVGLCHKYLQQFIKPGITTKEIDKYCYYFMLYLLW